MREGVRKGTPNIACPTHIWPVYRDWQIIPESDKTRKRNQKKLIFGTWNVRTLLNRERRSALIAKEL